MANNSTLLNQLRKKYENNEFYVSKIIANHFIFKSILNIFRKEVVIKNKRYCLLSGKKVNTLRKNRFLIFYNLVKCTMIYFPPDIYFRNVSSCKSE